MEEFNSTQARFEELLEKGLVEDDLYMDIPNDRNELSLDEEPDSTELQTVTKNTATLKPLSFKYVQWKDNLSEMKHFCLDDCKIEYMVCYIDDYWMLTVNDCIKDKWVSVALNDYVVKLDEGYTVINNRMFNKYFNK